MKTIGILPIKNEEAFLPTFLSSILQVCDKIIVIDDDSTDASVEILEKNNKCEVHKSKDINSWGGKRNSLINLARDNSATHIIALDADEAFTNPFILNFDMLMNNLPLGYKYTMHWLPMWKSYSRYRHDGSVWSNSFKDFILHDDGSLNYSGNWIHEPRLPISDKYIQIPTELGAVFHFQFSHWEAFQLKQSWYRCLERVANPNKNVYEINSTYSITLDDYNVNLKRIESNWTDNVVMPDNDKVYEKAKWRLEQIKQWFEQYGVEYFSDLNIWHVVDIKKLKNEKN